MSNSTLYLVWALVVVIFIVICLAKNKSYENYGGPIKLLRRIPKNDCYNICGQYYTDCMAPYYQGRYIDAGDCQRRRDSCIAVCNYSDFQRL